MVDPHHPDLEQQLPKDEFKHVVEFPHEPFIDNENLAPAGALGV